MRRRYLLDPCFIESLHCASALSPSLAAWHHAIAEPSVSTVWPTARAEQADRLGNSILPLLLRVDPHWCGCIRLRTDLYGRVRFPLCNWCIALGRAQDGPATVMADEGVTAEFTRRDVHFLLGTETGNTLLVVPRDDWLRMLIGNEDEIDGQSFEFGRSEVAVRLHFAGAIPRWRVRYEPAVMVDFERHAGLTGGVVAAALAVIRRHSAAVASEFDRLMAVVRGWELAAAGYGTLQSFSDPTLPRVMGINVPYGPDDEPQVCPFCFTWFGHELGHTKSYLIETILHMRGHSLTSNPQQRTDVLERYGRRLALRTLLQIPYTHLYEWTLLLDALEGNFAALPWAISQDPLAFGDEIQREIEEAFDLLSRESELTPLGHAILARLWGLSKEVLVRWRQVRRTAIHLA